MAIKGVGITVSYTAWNTNTNGPQTGDAANHTVKLLRDGVESAATNAPAEVDSISFKGEYKITLTNAEMTCDFITIGGVSSTANVALIPVKITTEHGVLQGSGVFLASSGLSNITLETGVGLQAALEFAAAALAGKFQKNADGTFVIYAVGNPTVPRIAGSLDGNGNRTITALTP